LRATYADLKPWFKKIEGYAVATHSTAPWQAGDRDQFQPVDELPDASSTRCRRPAWRRVKDYNERGWGDGYLQFSTRNGVRCNTRMAYLIRPRAYLVLKTGALVSRVLLEGKRAVGVRARVDGTRATSGQPGSDPVRRLQFATVAQLSGIGWRDVLAAAGCRCGTNCDGGREPERTRLQPGDV
jgi:choline dehydrogenase